ncbi:MAG: hypothetical protein QOD06_2739 [Candidatus Binatota bacterium]|jgi:MoaA/NifB/PqqE/SkfB family radical SAM enzyme|nr:hypothetical protein [Candidatus Binatota bacterium]
MRARASFLPVELEAPTILEPDRLSVVDWLRYGPFLAQVVITRRCNLSCGYCFEFDKVSEPVPYAALERRLEKLADLRAWTVCLTGGEPTLHPDLLRLIRKLRELGIRRRQLITNGYRLNAKLVDGLNEAGLTDLQLSVDGVVRSAATVKVLSALRKRLELLANRATFRVVMSGVIGAAPPREALEVVDYAKSRGFSPRVLLVHDESGQTKLSRDELAAYYEVKRRIGRKAREAGDYREKLIRRGEAPFRCRAGSRYLYVDEVGGVHWCSQTRDGFTKSLLDYSLGDLREQFHAPKSCNVRCTIGCVRTASAFDGWRPQG